MTKEEILEISRNLMQGKCNACPICNGKACRNKMPGPGAKGSGEGAIKNYEAWQKYDLNMDTICDNKEADTSFSLFGKTFRIPVFAGPVGHVNLHYGDYYDDLSYNNILIPACKEAGIAAFSGDGMQELTMQCACEAIHHCGGVGIPTIKPWAKEVYEKKLQLALNSGAFAVAMDVDAAGLTFLKTVTPRAGRKNVEELKAIIDVTPVPFIVKGVMSVKGALKAKAAGASAIVVSNHGGRVLDKCPATADVLEEIVTAVNGEMKILVDGGIRSGIDIFKALALGADAVIIARPFVPMIYGGQKEGVLCYVQQLQEELKDTMEMCGASCLSEITRDMIR